MSEHSSHIDFIRVAEPITRLETKFGGSPVWLERPEWPLSRSSGQPMIFIGQIALEPDQFPNAVARMAYVFIADDPGGETWDADSGENAVVLQPGSIDIEHRDLRTGPTVPVALENPRNGEVEYVPAEFAVRLSKRAEPGFARMSELHAWTPAERDKYVAALEGNKIGGSPLFLDDARLPFEDWRLILQMDSSRVPFFVNFGFGGWGYAIANADCSRAKFLWQSG